MIWRVLPDKIKRMATHLVSRGLLTWSDILEVPLTTFRILPTSYVLPPAPCLLLLLLTFAPGRQLLLGDPLLRDQDLPGARPV